MTTEQVNFLERVRILTLLDEIKDWIAKDPVLQAKVIGYIQGVITKDDPIFKL